MILPFSTQLNGNPTYFVDKIWLGLIDRKLSTIDMCRAYETARKTAGHKPFSIVPHYKPKIHTLRDDVKNRWKVGSMIDFFINARQKSMFRFAPKIMVVSVQWIEIKWLQKKDSTLYWYHGGTVCIDGVFLDCKQCEQLAVNDGFDSVEDFFAYFNKDFKGKIIHWTDLRY